MDDEVRLTIEVEGRRDAVRLFEQYMLQWHIWEEKRIKGSDAPPTVETDCQEGEVVTISEGSDLSITIIQPIDAKSPA